LRNDIVVGCDYTVDLHAGDMIEDLEPFVIFQRDGQRRRRLHDAAA